MTQRATLKLKRAYEPAKRSDGMRVLVDRLWPRGLSKEDAAIDHWLKDLAPSTALRRWFVHEPARWPEFRRRYRAELAKLAEPVAAARKLTRGRVVTLVYGARDERCNNAVVLKEVLRGK